MKIKDASEIVVGLVLFFETSQAKPAKGNFDAFALAKKHPYVCTARNAAGGNSTWLFMTSDQYRADAGCVFVSTDKDGHESWTSKKSYYEKDNTVTLTDEQVINLAKGDISSGENKVKLTSLSGSPANSAVKKAQIVPAHQLNPNAKVFVPSGM